MLARLTRIERDISSMEDKESLAPPDPRKVKRLKEQVKEIDRDFEQRHLEVLNFIESEDRTTLDSEEKIFDEHVNRVSDLIERLEELEMTESPVSTPTVVADPSLVLIKRLRYMDQEKAAIVEAVQSPPPGTDPDRQLWLQECQKEIESQLAGIMGEILALPGDENALMDDTASIKKALEEANYKASRCCKLSRLKVPVHGFSRRCLLRQIRIEKDP